MGFEDFCEEISFDLAYWFVIDLATFGNFLMMGRERTEVVLSIFALGFGEAKGSVKFLQFFDMHPAPAILLNGLEEGGEL